MFLGLESRGTGSNCAKLYFSVLYATLTGQFGFRLGEARQDHGAPIGTLEDGRRSFGWP